VTLIVKGSSLSAQAPSGGGKPTAILNIEGLEKGGKTRLALTAPKPIAYFRIGDRKIDFLLAELGIKRGIDLLEGVYHYRPPIAVSADGNDNLVNVIAEQARPIWKKFANDFVLTLKDPKIRTIIVDNASTMYELRRLAKFGRLDQVPPILYQQVNNEMSWYMTVGRDCPGKNFIYIHRLKDKWVNVPNPKNPKGPKIGERTGELERSGWKDAGYEVDASIRVDKTLVVENGKKVAKFTATITDSGLKGVGETVEDDDITFANVCAIIFDTRPRDWEK